MLRQKHNMNICAFLKMPQYLGVVSIALQNRNDFVKILNLHKVVRFCKKTRVFILLQLKKRNILYPMKKYHMVFKKCNSAKKKLYGVNNNRMILRA